MTLVPPRDPADPRSLREASGELHQPLGDEQLGQALHRKTSESRATQQAFFEEHAGAVVQCARALATAVSEGARVFVFGNGGSACDAEHLAVELTYPVVEKRKPFPATVLGTQRALLTAVGNDEDFALAYVRELEVLAKPGDVAVGLSTSGKSRNVVRTLKAARELGLITVGFAGRDGGSMVGLCDHSFVVRSFSIHRIQETHGVLLHVVWDLMQLALGEEDVL
jgi:D-sedoheptulose 7-phosphate isomerase